MIKQARQKHILDCLVEMEKISVNDLAETLNASKETLRRDLTELADQGLLRKIHGGAMRLQAAIEQPLDERLLFRNEDKKILASIAASMIHPGDSLFINGGSTAIALAAELSDIGNLTVITSSLLVAQTIWKSDTKNLVYLLGGEYDGHDQETTGPLVVEQVKGFFADYAFLGVGAVNSKSGFMDYKVEIAAVAQAMQQQAGKVIVMADASKIEQRALVTSCTFENADIFVTDEPVIAEMKEVLSLHNIEVMLPQPQ